MSQEPPLQALAGGVASHLVPSLSNHHATKWSAKQTFSRDVCEAQRQRCRGYYCGRQQAGKQPLGSCLYFDVSQWGAGLEHKRCRKSLHEASNQSRRRRGAHPTNSIRCINARSHGERAMEAAASVGSDGMSAFQWAYICLNRGTCLGPRGVSQMTCGVRPCL